ncbi:MAG: MFS transporter [Bacteroidota bacterium]
MTHNRSVPGFWQIWNMSIGFMGIQFGWSLQMSNMSAIYEYLDAKPDEIPLLFLAAPLTGLIVQPIVGYLSDRTWNPSLGRRRPYFLIGALFSTICLIWMPHSSALWMAAGLLWILDSSINVSMEPFRAFIADQLPEEKRTSGFAMQSFMIGIGASVASALPWIFRNWFGISDARTESGIPLTVTYSFYCGAVAFMAAVAWTVFTTREQPPADLEEFKRNRARTSGFMTGVREIIAAIRTMPKTMRQLALVQFFTWPGLFLMWFYYSPAVARNVFGATSDSDPLYTRGIEYAGITLSFYNIVTFLFAFLLPPLAAKLGRKYAHACCLVAGAAGLISVAFITDPKMLFVSMAGVGIAWASILSMPYAMLSGSIPPEKTGIYMGIFNFFIVLPEIIASLTFGWVMSNVLGNDRLSAVMIGGVLMLVAALLSLRVRDSQS